MDVPSANCVIRFDPMHHAVSLVQGRGRARQENSAFVVLQERKDRPTHKLASAEKQQIELIRNFKPAPCKKLDSKDIQAQESRERIAVRLLAGKFDRVTCSQILNSFCQKTKVALDKKVVQVDSKFTVRMKYASVLRSISVETSDNSKKGAMSAAALEILVQLQKELDGHYS